MRRFIIIPLLFLSVILCGTNYYVATDGNDSNPGTLAEPFLTVQHGIDQLTTGGDTLFIRGGTYYPTTTIDISAHSGSSGNYIVVMGYPSDVLAGNKPTIDCTNMYQVGGLAVEDVDYWVLRDFDICNAKQDGATYDVRGAQAYRALYIYFINIGSYGHGGPGFELSNASGTHQTIGYFINCDSYDNCDTDSSLPGNDADGFGNNGYYWYTGDSINMRLEDTTKWVKGYYYNCRAWNNSDDGIGHAYGAYAYHYNCYSINNGNVSGMTGDGRGFTAGHQYYTPPDNQYVFQNCVSAYNGSTGFRVNSGNEIYTSDIVFYNNLSYNDPSGFNSLVDEGLETHPVIYRNNIAYPFAADKQVGWWPGYDYAFTKSPFFNPTYDHNSWDLAALTDDDFVTLDTAGYRDARQADGSLPDNRFYNYFGHLNPNSDYIDAGINVGIDTVANGADVGAFEFPYAWMINDYLYLPPTTDTLGIPFIVGKTDTIYGNNIGYIPNETEAYWDITYTCDIGSQVGDDFILTPDAGDVGLHTFVVDYIYPPDTTVYASDTAYIKVYTKTTKDTITVLSIGDSNTLVYFDEVAQAWMASLDNSEIITVGHVGDPGWWEIEDIYTSAVSGSSHAWWATSSSSPIRYNGAIDLAYYFANRELPTANVIPDIVYMNLGGADIGAWTDPEDGDMTEADLNTICGYLEQIVDAFLAYDEDLIFVIGLLGKPVEVEATWDAAYPDQAGYSYRRIENTQRFAKRVLETYQNNIYDNRVFVDFSAWYLDRANMTNIHKTRAGYYQQALGNANTFNAVLRNLEDIDSTATDILIFTLSEQTGAATINTTNHTVSIEVAYTADITDLTPTITLSYGATIIPASGVSRDFTSPLPYTVTALDGVTYQEWTVTVTQEAEPEPEPVASTGRIVKLNGKIVKR